MERNPNLDRHMAAVNEAITQAQARAPHAHVGVRVDICGSTQSGPILNWEYDPEGADGYGWVEILNYKGETVRKPLTDAALYDVRPCWDHGCTPG